MTSRRAYKQSFGAILPLVTAGIAAVIVPLALGILGIPPISAQQPATALEFDAVSIKPANPNSPNGTVVGVTPGGALHVVNATLKDLIETAYEVRSFQIQGGPRWIEVTGYDVDANPGTPPRGAGAPSPGWSNVRLKTQSMLKDRFQLQFHRKTKSVQVYSLTVAKGGINSRALSASQSPHRGTNAGPGTMVGEAASMMDLANKLSKILGRPVVNNTSLEGNYDFQLQWTPDPAPSTPELQPLDAAGPSLFSALEQQLGLRLEATRGPVDVLVIDHVERPSDN